MATILLIEDSDASRAEIREALEADGPFDRILEASDGIEGLRALLGEAIDVVLCNLELPGLDGDKLLRLRDARADSAPIPFLFITASQNMARRTRLLEDGACDALSKPFHAPDLVARLRLHLQIKQLQDELLVKNRRLEDLSRTDLVTGLRTRRAIEEVLEAEFRRAERYGTPLSVLMADLDHFKQVNDSYGHVAGDAVLRAVSDRVQAQLRATDVAGRYGGEEFLVVLQHNDHEGAVVVAERWRESVAAEAFELADGRAVRATLSIGVASFAPGMKTRQELVTAADAALYKAKDDGRNRVAVFAG